MKLGLVEEGERLLAGERLPVPGGDRGPGRAPDREADPAGGRLLAGLAEEVLALPADAVPGRPRALALLDHRPRVVVTAHQALGDEPGVHRDGPHLLRLRAEHRGGEALAGVLLEVLLQLLREPVHLGLVHADHERRPGVALRPAAGEHPAPEDGPFLDQVVQHPLELVRRAAGQAVLDRLDGLGDGVEPERHLGLVRREQPLQDAQLDARLGRRVAHRQLVEALLQAPVDVPCFRHRSRPFSTPVSSRAVRGSTGKSGQSSTRRAARAAPS